jgi:PAS domain S-box-containing protein
MSEPLSPSSPSPDPAELKPVEDRLRETVEQLARSEARIRAALDGARMICWDLDLTTNLWETTADLSDFYGLPRGVDYTKQPGGISAVHPDDLAAVLAGRQRAIEADEPMRYEFRGRVPSEDGSTRWFSTRGRVLRDADGKPVRLVAVTTDITERKRAEEEREALNRQLQDAQRWESLGVLAGGIAHDFNNILTVILGSAGLGRKALPAGSPALLHFEQIEQASRRAAELCRQLLAYAGRGQAAAGRTDLNRLIRNSTALFSVAAGKSASFRLELEDGLPPVAADAAPARQVLVNLVTNALEAVGDDAGEVVIATDRIEISTEAPIGYHLQPSPGRYVRLVITDTGPGISPEVQRRMFDPFFTTKFPGRGLGLAAVLGIMRTHHGGIRMVSESGKGVRAEVLWPEVSPAAIEEPATPRLSGQALVVDDEASVREVTAASVRGMGFESLLAGDGAAALELFRRHHPTIRVAVLDVVMPGMGGDQLLRELRVISPNLPAVLVSGFTDRSAVESIVGATTEFVQKPFHPEELIAAIQRVLRIRT